jgi:putative FmdB family regulatory protein
MPTYEYICENCRYEFEMFQRISAEPLRICPRCNQQTVVRKISGGTGLIFKGSGFYITDYSKKKNSLATPAEKPKEAQKAAPDTPTKADKKDVT